MADNKENVLDRMLDSLYLKQAVKDCYKGLCENPQAVAFQSSAGEMLNLETNEQYQVQIIVTKEDFLGGLDIVQIEKK